jgi:chemotaxis protein CheX
MKVEFINPFVVASFSVLESLLGDTPTKGALAMHPTVFTSQQCNIMMGVAGKVEGQVLYGMALSTALGIASKMIGQPVRTFDELANSAVAELGNMITGNAMTLLAQAGFPCDITPPAIIRGRNLKLSTLNIPALVVPICISQGTIELTVSLRERPKTWTQ